MFNLSLLCGKSWLSLHLWFAVAAAAGATQSSLAGRDFQVDFLRALSDQAEQRAESSLNEYLKDLAANASYSGYREQLANAIASPQLHLKVLLIKQVLDADQQHGGQLDLVHTCVLRNLVFLGRLKQQLRAARDASAQEMRQLRVHRLCQQFERPAGEARPRPFNEENVEASLETRPRLINEQTVGAALKQLNLTDSTLTTNASNLDVNKFGEDLYERVKLSGAEIIDNYVLIIRGILQDILDAEHADLVENTTELERVLKQLDQMLAIADFFEKRQSVYAFLERHLSVESDQLRGSSNSDQHITEQLLAQLKAKGLDLFVIFLFSNFEFLEQVHGHWSQLLPQPPGLLLTDDTVLLLYDIQDLYERFKLHTESSSKYETYAAALRRLHERTVEQGQQNHHIFEMVSNAAQNVGTVTFNMIKAKCKELL